MSKGSAGEEDVMALVSRLRRSGKTVSALCACRAAVSTFPEKIGVWEVYLELCDATAGHDEKMLAALGLLEWRQDDKKALRIASEAAFEAGDMDSSGEHASRLTIQMTDKPVGWLQLSRVCRRIAKPEEAMAYVERALYLNPSFASGILQKSILLAEKGDKDGAGKLFRSAHAINPSLAKKTALEEKALGELKLR